MLFSPAARRVVITNCTRQLRSKCRPSSTATYKRSIVSLTTQQQYCHGVDRMAQPLIWCPNSEFVPTKAQQKRYMSSDELPYHIVVGMPALSPTMESGTISKWNVKEGDSFSAGDSLAVIETDKASMDFEAQDDGVVAKILVSEGGGELNVGLPIIVTVEEEGDVASFTNFVPEEGGGGGAPSAEESSSPAPSPPSPPAADLPDHIVMGMPALSPTMDSGTISKWNVSEGESFSAGDSIAVIETDKASMDFEAQDDGLVAKVLVEAGAGEVAVGVPVMVTVEEEGDVAAFANFEAGHAPNSAATEAEVTPEPIAAAAAAPEVSATPTPAPPNPPVAASAPTPQPIAAATPLDAILLGGSDWGKLAAEKSPLAKLLASKQKQYIEQYGSTGHVPIV